GDLARATELLLDARLNQGLGAALVSHASVSTRESPTLLNEIDRELQTLLANTIAVLEADRDVLLSLSEKLLKDRILTGDEIAAELGLKPTEKDTAKRPPLPTSNPMRAATTSSRQAAMPIQRSAPLLREASMASFEALFQKMEGAYAP